MKTETLFENLMYKARLALSWVKNLDWTNPRILLTSLLFIFLPFIAGYFILTGLILGLTLCIAMLFLVDKSPEKFKQYIKKYPLVSDLALSSLSVYTLGGYFGSGLTLGIGAVFCAIFLSISIPHIKIQEQPLMAAA